MSKHNNHAGAPGKNVPDEEKTPVNQTEAQQPQGGQNPGETPQSQASEKSADKSVENESKNAGGQPEKEKTPAEKIIELEAKLAEANDLYLRKAADFENFRKRMNREKQDAIEYANQSLLVDLIVTMDDFERALKSAESAATGEFKAFYEGILLIEKRLCTQLENKWGLKRYNSAGELFDPNLHEAIQMEKSADISEPVVAEEYYKGYTLKDRVVRHAKVKVRMPEKNTPAEEPAKTPENAG